MNLVTDAQQSDRDALLESVADARARAWRAVGDVDPYVSAHIVNPAFFGGPSWPGFRQAFVHVRLPDGRPLAATDGLTDPYEDAPDGTGVGAELFLVNEDLPGEASTASASWAFQLLYQAAQNIAYQGPAFVAGIERYGALSMSIPGVDAPEVWSDGVEVGVLLGVPVPGLPSTIELPTGAVRALSVLPLRREELDEILDGGAEARRDIADRMSRLDAATLASNGRPSVLD